MVPGPMTEWYAKLVRNENHALRLLPAHVQVRSDLCLVEDSIFFVHYERGEELAIRIAHRTCAASLRAVFELIWAGAAALRKEL